MNSEHKDVPSAEAEGGLKHRSVFAYREPGSCSEGNGVVSIPSGRAFFIYARLLLIGEQQKVFLVID